MFAFVVFDTPYCSESLRWLSPFCMTVLTGVRRAKISVVSVGQWLKWSLSGVI